MSCPLMPEKAGSGSMLGSQEGRETKQLLHPYLLATPELPLTAAQKESGKGPRPPAVTQGVPDNP